MIIFDNEKHITKVNLKMRMLLLSFVLLNGQNFKIFKLALVQPSH